MTEKTQSDVAATGPGAIEFHSLPAGTKVTPMPACAADGASSRGFLYTLGGEKTVVCIAHPRGDMSRHYAIPALLEAGFAAYGHVSRYGNNDIDCEHEKLLLDLAAGFANLKDTGFEKLILLGNSGGAGLFGFYQEQASTPPPGRWTDTVAGEPCDLNAIEMPKADGILMLAVHPGEGEFMLNNIDPSVVDENDPLLTDPTLDMYNPANGYRAPPEASRYSPEFLSRYRAAQRARVARLDARARSWIADQKRHQRILAEADFDRLPPEEQQEIRRRAQTGRYLVIYRTEANPAYADLSLHAWKSNRAVGSLLGPDAEQVNYQRGGFARTLTERAWLSSWSISSRANVLKNIKSIHEPLLMICYTRDNACFPEENQAQVDACPSPDKTLAFADADHWGMPLAGRNQAFAIMTSWLLERFPTASANDASIEKAPAMT